MTEAVPVLEAAGVVDAGGTGLLLFLEALLHEIDGRPITEASSNRASRADKDRSSR